MEGGSTSPCSAVRWRTAGWIGGFAAALGGLDTLAFAASIGENAPAVRAWICEGLPFLRVEIEEERNLTNAKVISTETNRVAVCVIHRDEEVVIAESVCCDLNLLMKKEKVHGQQNSNA